MHQFYWHVGEQVLFMTTTVEIGRLLFVYTTRQRRTLRRGNVREVTN